MNDLDTERLVLKILAHQDNRPLSVYDFTDRLSYIRDIFLPVRPSQGDIDFTLRRLIAHGLLSVTVEVRGPGWEAHRETCVSIKSPLDLIAAATALEQEGWE